MDKAAREALALRTLGCAGTVPVEAIVFDRDAGLTRFTQNAIHQNVAYRETSVRVRTIVDNRTGVAQTNDLSDASLHAVVARSQAIATVAPRDEDFAGLTRGGPVPSQAGAYVAATAAADAALRARLTAELIAPGEREGLWAAGYVSTARSGITIANANGTLVSFDGTECGLNVKQNGADSSGFAEAYEHDIGLVDATRVGTIAAEKALHSAAPQAVEPGAWTVILEPPAFGELLSYLSEHFSAQAFDEGSSFLSDGLERSYAGSNVALEDDFTHPLHAGMPFDYEGYPAQRTALLAGGVAKNVVTDAAWAARLRRPNTGNALPQPSSDGPQVRHMVVFPGQKTLAELIAETKRGLLISRFWYIRPVDQRKTIVTGMTRDGTFLIENGRLAGGVRNMRFNQSILDALRHAQFSDRQVRTHGFSYASVVPAVSIEGFTFTSLTDF